MIFSIWFLVVLRKHSWRNTTTVGINQIVTGIALLLSPLWDNIHYFTFWIILVGFLNNLATPEQTSIYQENYPKNLRGKLFGWSLVLHFGASTIFFWLIGKMLEWNFDSFRLFLIASGLASIVAGFLVLRIPSPTKAVLKITGLPQEPALSMFRWLFKDKLFGYMILVWYIFGLANLMTLPLRILYLSEPQYGLNYPAGTVALALGVIPDLLRVVMTPVWAYFFDRYNFIGLRLSLNFFLTLSILLFFFSKSLTMILLAGALQGIFFAGGNLAWNLWVTHFAPSHRIGEYMALHVFFTGTRGIIGVFLGVNLVPYLGMSTISYIAAGLSILSIVMMLPIRHLGKREALARRHD